MTTKSARTFAVGDVLTGRPVEKVTRTQIVRYAGASGDFTPLHHDEPYTVALGNPAVFAMGMMTAGFLSRALDEWFGPGNLVRFKIRFLNRVWPDDSLRFTGTVRERDEAAGTVTVDLQVLNQKDEAVIGGEAVARV
jgi:acyl dehydratase